MGWGQSCGSQLDYMTHSSWCYRFCALFHIYLGNFNNRLVLNTALWLQANGFNQLFPNSNMLADIWYLKLLWCTLDIHKYRLGLGFPDLWTIPKYQDSIDNWSSPSTAYLSIWKWSLDDNNTTPTMRAAWSGLPTWQVGSNENTCWSQVVGNNSSLFIICECQKEKQWDKTVELIVWVKQS